jgi:hypothetical protein
MEAIADQLSDSAQQMKGHAMKLQNLVNFRGSLAKSYVSAVLLVVCALVPFLALSSSAGPLMLILGKGVHLSPQALSLTLGMSNAAHALGTVLAVQLAVHYPQRRLLVAYAAGTSSPGTSNAPPGARFASTG